MMERTEPGLAAIAARMSATERAAFKFVNMGVSLVYNRRTRYPTKVSFKHD